MRGSWVGDEPALHPVTFVNNGFKQNGPGKTPGPSALLFVRDQSPLIVRTTLDVGRSDTVGSFCSFCTSAS